VRDVDSDFDLSHLARGFRVQRQYWRIIDFVGSNWTTDTVGHGTHVAGIIAAADNDIGVVGVAPSAKIHVVDAFDGAVDGTGICVCIALIEAAYSCRDAWANVISMSIGGPYFFDYEAVVFTELLHVNGILSIAAAGSSGDWRLGLQLSRQL
jgi:serine protease